MSHQQGFWDEIDGCRTFFPACGYAVSTRKFLSVNGVRLWLEEEGRGPPILLIHGGPGVDHRSLHPGLSVLAPDYRLVYFDLRGHYMSSAPRDRSCYGLEVDVDDAAAVIRELSLRDACVLGHSFGGIVALSLAARYPQLVKRAVITSCPVGETDEEVESRLSADPQSVATNRARSEEEREERYLEFYYFRPPDPLTREFAILSRRCYAMRKNKRMLADRGATDVDWKGLLSEVTCPTLFLYGREDPIVSGRSLREVTRPLPDSMVVEFRNSRHEIFSDRPREFHAVVHRFLSETFSKRPRGVCPLFRDFSFQSTPRRIHVQEAPDHEEWIDVAAFVP